MVRSARPLRIWLVTVGEPLPGYSSGDRLWRCGFLAKLLANRGHEVTWWTSTFDHFNKRFFEPAETSRAINPGLSLQFLDGRPYAKNISIARFLNHRDLARRFAAVSLMADPPDVIAASYPPIELCRAVAIYGASHGIPVFNDIRDLWPDEMVVRAPRWGRTVAKLFSLPLRWQAIEALRKSTGLIAISEAYLSWGLAMTGRQRGPSDQVIPLGYTGQATPDSCPDDVMNRLCASGVDPSRQIFWFCGTFVGNIDLKTVIDAAEILAGNQNLQFVLTGDGERAAEWKAHARNRSNVVFTGWLGAAEIAGMSSMSYVGLAAYKPGASMSLPNKLFEYMSAGLPILSCLAGEAAEVIQANDIGVSYVAGQAVDLADRILDISRDTSTRERQATNARALFQRKYSAQVIYNRYADFLETAACAQLESAS